MPLAHILMPQLARKAEEIAAATGHPSPGNGYLQAYDTAYQTTPRPQANAYMNGIAEGADKARKDMTAEAVAKAREEVKVSRGKAFLQPISDGTHRTADKNIGPMQNAGPDASFRVDPKLHGNYVDPTAPFVGLLHGAPERVQEGKPAFDPKTFATLMQKDPGFLAEMIGRIPGDVEYKNNRDYIAASDLANLHMPEPHPNGYLGPVAPEDSVAEGDIGKTPEDPYQQLLPRDFGPKDGIVDPFERVQPQALDSAKARELQKVMAGITDQNGAGIMVDRNMSPGQAAESIGKMLDATRRAKMGYLDPSNMVYGI